MSYVKAPPHRKLEVELGDLMTLAGHRNRWTVQAVSENFVAIVQQAPFEPKGTLQYSIIDWRNGLRGPCDMVGQSYGDGSYSTEDCAAMLEQFEWDPLKDPAYLEAQARGEHRWIPTKWHLEVSHRNNVAIEIVAINGEPVQSDAEYFA